MLRSLRRGRRRSVRTMGGPRAGGGTWNDCGYFQQPGLALCPSLVEPRREWLAERGESTSGRMPWKYLAANLSCSPQEKALSKTKIAVVIPILEVVRMSQPTAQESCTCTCRVWMSQITCSRDILTPGNTRSKGRFARNLLVICCRYFSILRKKYGVNINLHYKIGTSNAQLLR
jgi:hypothetical protein